MTVLQALAARYYRAAPGALPISGFAPIPISFTLVLDADGHYVTTHDERQASGKTSRPRTVLAPAAPKRSSGVAPAAFWDKTSTCSATQRPI